MNPIPVPPIFIVLAIAVVSLTAAAIFNAVKTAIERRKPKRPRKEWTNCLTSATRWTDD